MIGTKPKKRTKILIGLNDLIFPKPKPNLKWKKEKDHNFKLQKIIDKFLKLTPYQTDLYYIYFFYFGYCHSNYKNPQTLIDHRNINRQERLLSVICMNVHT